MIIGEVVSSVISSRKYDSLSGIKFLVIKPCFGNTEDYFVAADAIGAGEGELVMVTKGENTKFALEKEVPVDAVVIGILDKRPTI